MTILQDYPLQVSDGALGETALPQAKRVQLIQLTLVAGTAAQAGLPLSAIVTGYARTVAGGTTGDIECALAAGTLTLTSSNVADTSTVIVQVQSNQ